MKRKIIQLAKRTLVLSLPADWTKKHDLKKGDELHIQEKQNHLILKTTSKLTPYEITIKAPESSLIKQILADLYIRGYDKITINYKSPQVLDHILKEQLIGFEIVDQEENKVVLKNIITADIQEFDTVLRRLFLLTKQITQQATPHLQGQATSILPLEVQSNKLSNYSRRLLNKHGYEPSYKVNPLYTIITDLERLGDIYKYLVKNKVENTQAREVFEQISELYDSIYKQCYKYNQTEIEKIHQNRSKLLDQAGNIQNPMLKHFALAATRQTCHLLGSIISMNA